ncbi:hypothetical protein HNQ91_003417 [Filimonas zeae]|uniref:GmrSD restriction endonucleases N-terminal domain-containing protein n=1 Tax=Filimonas zeae TaxID=1737353 RepID=A0A917IZ00_9BACT|nr:DUF262 domain-containing protein [Filimonas zeae]MDR6340352.1 hypothetical protein [Filimonas zeae]GGH72334.1 hypothetical protein GCM10011379_32640 [Filimonas zeae]
MLLNPDLENKAACQNSFDTFFSIKDIAFWQLNNHTSNVELPTLQRTFVWRPNQIEELWDSLLRGFPIGSFLLSQTGKSLYLLDGQQRATAIALGFYNPWTSNQNERFWSLRNVPSLWIDLAPQVKTLNQRFVPRLITRSHPWGYQRKDNKSALTVSEKRKALFLLRKHESNSEGGYTKFDLKNVFPYDCDISVPLSFLLEAVVSNDHSWKEHLFLKCENLLPTKIIKSKDSDEDYLVKLQRALDSSDVDVFFNGIKRLVDFKVPAIVIESKVLQNDSDENESGENPTLFVRLNSSGTHIGGEELIYSIYKSIFPDSKRLIEHIGRTFILSSLVVSIVSRIAYSEITNGDYPAAMSVNEFRSRIAKTSLKGKMQNLIGEEIENSPIKLLFDKAFDILQGGAVGVNVPPILIRNIVNGNPDLLLILLWWLKSNPEKPSKDEQRAMIGGIMAIGWFCKDVKKYVRQVWPHINEEKFWTKELFSRKNMANAPFMPYLVDPGMLFSFLRNEVTEKKVEWHNLLPEEEDELYHTYINLSYYKDLSSDAIRDRINDMWSNFISKLIWNRSLLIFAQRDYIREQFEDYDRFESLEDTNVPWDWDHIYPSEWVYGKQNVDPNIRHWNNTIGNLRALALEQNRSEGNGKSPKERLEDAHKDSFICSNDWEYWKDITARVYRDDREMVTSYLNAVVTRIYNIYSEWYTTFNMGGN